MSSKVKKPCCEKMEKKVKRAKEEKSGEASACLREFPRSMPALERAQRVTERASAFGFDWRDADPVWHKLDEEIAELKAAIASGNKVRIGEELGDLFFSLVNLSRFLHVEAEEALTWAVDRFVKRFDHIEAKIAEQGKTLLESTLEEMDLLWEEAKRMER